MVKRLAILLVVLGVAAVFQTYRLHAADTGFPIYFDTATLTVKSQIINRATYLPLVDIVRYLSLPYTDSTSLETLTIRGQNSRIVLTKNSGLISVNDQVVLLQSPVLHESNQWLVPVEFLSQGLSRITGIDFRRRPSADRVFAGKGTPPELVMNAQALGSITRLTIRATIPIAVDLRRDIPMHRATLLLDPRPIDPLRERLDYRDRMAQSIAFDDSDGIPKIAIELTDTVTDVRVTPGDDNRVYFIDLSGAARTTESAPATAPASAPAAAAAKPDAIPTIGLNAPGGIRVIVIDPGHGGMDTGTSSTIALEKDLTLAIARKLRTTLQSQLGATVLLTRDSDIELTSEARSAVANNNQADLFISLHVGYSSNAMDSGSSIYIIQNNFAAKLPVSVSGTQLFLPWYLGYRLSRQSSEQVANILQEELSKTVPGWKFPVRSGPIGVLASTTMPAVAIEIGNLNNAVNSKTMLDTAFQGRLTSSIAAAIERFATERVHP